MEVFSGGADKQGCVTRAIYVSVMQGLGDLGPGSFGGI
jgi:hypothetical protein